MAEEQRCREAHRLCANNCGVFGSPATQNLCSKCYSDSRMKEEQASSAKIAVEKSLRASPSSVAAADPPVADVTPASPGAGGAKGESPSGGGPSAPANRCSACGRKVGVLGFKCRCGATFCGAHRYAEQHACGFDFKRAGREAIARANPVVKAEKLDKI